METLKSGTDTIMKKLQEDIQEIQDTVEDTQEYVERLVRTKKEVKPNSEEQYTIRVRKETNKTKRDAEMGSIIKTTKHYESYFTPVEENSQMSQTTDDTSASTSIKLKYVGKEDIYKNLLKEYTEYPEFFMTRYIELFTHTLTALEKLEENKIVHFDMKGKHIMIDENTKQPKIYNFGEGFTESMLENPKECFYMYEPNYTHWCYEIHLMSYLLYKQKGEWESEKIPLQVLEKVWKETTKGRIFKEYRSVREKLQTIMKNAPSLEDDMYAYMENLQDKTGKEIQDELMKTICCWDAYALSLIFVSFLIETSMYEEIENPLFNKIKQYLEDIVTSVPSNRKTNSDLKEEWLSIIENMEKDEWSNMNNRIVSLSKEQDSDENKQKLLMSRESEITNALKARETDNK